MASNTVKDLSATVLGATSTRFYRLVFNTGAGISFIPILIMVVFFPDRHIYTVTLPGAVFLLGGQIFAILMLLFSLFQTGAGEFLGIRQVFSDKHSSSQKMVVKGFYRYVRHPLYSAGMLFIWFSPYMTQNILTLNIGITLYFLIGTFFEERRLVKDFGQQYLDYKDRTPRFIPRFSDLISNRNTP
jgi:protein-S-isoprenylcysteine O-methyltransferase Ste14